MTMKIPKALPLILVIAGIAGYSVCHAKQKPKPNQFSGTLELTEHSLGARVAGRVTTLRVEDGQIVSKGQLIATLDRFDQAERDHQRVLELYKTGGATHQQLEEAELTLNDQRVVSPVDGVVLVRAKLAGEVVSSGQAIVVLGDRHDIWARIFIPEGVINRVRMNMPATLHLDGLKETYQGHVTYIAPSAEFTPRNVQSMEERVTQTFAVKVSIDNPPDTLRPGVNADVELGFEK
jgi:HlyD family secretion protein